jgi:hypothetical protein
VRLTPKDGGGDRGADLQTIRARAVRSVQRGAVINAVGCCLLIADQAGRSGSDRGDLARSVYLLLGGSAISAVYRFLLGERSRLSSEPPA